MPGDRPLQGRRVLNFESWPFRPGYKNVPYRPEYQINWKRTFILSERLMVTIVNVA